MVGFRRSLLLATFLILSVLALPAGLARAAAITGVSLSKGSFNPGETIAVSVTTDGSFDPNNVFTVQISGINGSFTQARSIGVQAAASPSGPIEAKIPCDLSPGAGYRIRVVANSPAATGPDNGADLEIRPRPAFMVTPSGPTTLCKGDSVVITGDSGYARYRWNTGDTTRSITVRQTGIYSLTATDTNECGLVGRATVTVLPGPAPSIRQTGGRRVETDPIYSAYQWGYSPDWHGTPFTPIPGATSPVLQADKVGDYIVMVTDTNGCSGPSDPLRVIIEGVAWTKASDAGVKIYPIPARDRVTVEASLDHLTSVTITVSDLSGRTLLALPAERAAGSYRRNLDIGALPAGTYLLLIELGEKRVGEKVEVGR